MADSEALPHRSAPDDAYVGVRGIWLRKIGDQVQVLAEGGDGWYLVISEREDGSYSHIVEPSGIIAAPPDPLRSSDG